MAWHREWRDRDFYLVMKKWRKQWCFEVVVLEQMQVQVCNGECLKQLGSNSSNPTRIHNCHGLCLKKTEFEDEVPAGKWCCKKLLNVVQMKKTMKRIRVFWSFWQKKCKVEKCKNERMWVSVVWLQCLGLANVRKCTLYCLFYLY